MKDILRAPVLGFEDVNESDDLGYQTPLQWAADGGIPKLIKMLIDAGADPDASGAHPDQFTPLHIAALNGNADAVQVTPAIPPLPPSPSRLPTIQPRDTVTLLTPRTQNLLSP